MDGRRMGRVRVDGARIRGARGVKLSKGCWDAARRRFWTGLGESDKR